MTTEQQITRRQAVKVVGTAGAVYLLAPALPAFSPTAALAATAGATAAKLTPELTEGPYWVNTMLHRSASAPTRRGGAHQKAFRSSSHQRASTRATAASRSTASRSTSGTQMPTACTPTRPRSKPAAAARGRGHDQRQLAARVPDHRKDRGLRNRPVLRPGELPDDLARLVHRPRDPYPRPRPQALTPAARQSPATRPRSSSPTPTTTTCSPARRPTTPARPKRSHHRRERHRPNQRRLRHQHRPGAGQRRQWIRRCFQHRSGHRRARCHRQSQPPQQRRRWRTGGLPPTA